MCIAHCLFLQEINQLKELKVIDRNLSIFFVRVPKPKKAPPETHTKAYKKSHIDNIRATLKKNHISEEFGSHERQSYSVSARGRLAKRHEDVARQDGHSSACSSSQGSGASKRRKSAELDQQSLTSSIKVFMPCQAHGKASCSECALHDSLTTVTSQCRRPISDVTAGTYEDSSGSDIEAIDSGSDTSMDTQVSTDDVTAARQRAGGYTLALTAEAKAAVNLRQNDSTVSLADENSIEDFSLSLFQQLLDCNYLSMLPPSLSASVTSDNGVCEAKESELAESFKNLSNFVQYFHHQLQKILTNTVSLLNVVHTRCLQKFILTAFDMARDMQVTPRKLEYARNKERLLFEHLVSISDEKQDEIREMIAATVQGLRQTVLDKAEEYDFIGSLATPTLV